MKKEDWKNLAVQYGIGFDEWSTVRYFVEKIAEKIGVDDKIVNTNELKKEVIAKITESNSEQPEESGEATKSEAVTPVDDLTSLREECDKLGIGWSEVHTINDLKSVVDAVKQSGVTPTTPVATSESTEVDLEKLEDVKLEEAKTESIKPVLTAPVNKNQSKIDTKNLEVYRDVIVAGIRSHWRKMYSHEITEILNKGNYPFTYVMKNNPSNPLQLEILITMSGSTVRIPSQKNHDWIEING